MTRSSFEVGDLSIISQTRVLPEKSLDNHSRQLAHLSILDATVVSFAPTAASWLYDRPVHEQDEAGLATDQLVRSLRKTLDAYPQWAGQLHWASYDSEGDHTQRFHRIDLIYGTMTDPGVEVVIAHCPRTLSAIVPSVIERVAGSACFDAGQISALQLLPKTSLLALHNLKDYIGLPGMIVQLTTFDCGGIAIALKVAHVLADAQAMINFVRDWASVNRAMLAHTTLPSLLPVFEPSLLDQASAGNIDAPKADAALLNISRSLPLHRYDWWASAEGCPEGLFHETQISPLLKDAICEPMGTPIPWSQWDLSVPVSHFLISFSPEEISRMWEEASSAASPAHVSHLDALLAHIWGLISRARGLENDEEEVHLDVTFGFRERLSLPEAFLGSPITNAKVSLSGREACFDSLEKKAMCVRSSLAQFNASTLPAFLHDLAFQADPHRHWNAFLGSRNTIITSWLRQHVYGIDFGGKTPPRYVEAVMPNVDGCVQIMEAGVERDDSDIHRNGTDNVHLKPWYQQTVSVSIHLATQVMQRLLKDPLLRKYCYQ